jgi:hypothetical protein
MTALKPRLPEPADPPALRIGGRLPIGRLTNLPDQYT